MSRCSIVALRGERGSYNQLPDRSAVDHVHTLCSTAPIAALSACVAEAASVERALRPPSAAALSAIIETFESMAPREPAPSGQVWRAIRATLFSASAPRLSLANPFHPYARAAGAPPQPSG